MSATKTQRRKEKEGRAGKRGTEAAGLNFTCRTKFARKNKKKSENKKSKIDYMN